MTERPLPLALGRIDVSAQLMRSGRTSVKSGPAAFESLDVIGLIMKQRAATLASKLKMRIARSWIWHAGRSST
jgi:hypothetical protein